jgi:ketosteroid isomerase-like protein
MKPFNATTASVGGAILALASAAGGQARAEADTEVAELAARAAAANEHLMRGDIARYRQVLQVTDDFTLMGPFGGRPSGVPAGDEDWARIGRFFENGREASFDLIASYFSDDLAVLVANEHAHVAVGGLPEQSWSLRVTLVFKRSGPTWQLAHRHADPLALGVSLKEAAALARSGER